LPTVSGPVGLALTNSTLTLCGSSTRTCPKSLPAATMSATRPASQPGSSRKFRKPGAATETSATLSGLPSAACRTSAIRIGEWRRTGASCMAALLA
jgi:hypothetical protein